MNRMTMQARIILTAVGTAAFLVAFLGTLKGAPETPKFDPTVRGEMFAGFMGDAAALDRALAKCDEGLAKNKDDAEALVWHGIGVFFKAGQAAKTGDYNAAGELLVKGSAEMDRAVELAPENPAVRVPRGAILLSGSRNMPEEMGRPLLEKALQDFEKTLVLQAASTAKKSPHARGELLFGLGEGWSRAGDTAKAQRYFELLVKEMPDTAYAKRAGVWLEKKALSESESNCASCHVE